MRFLEGFETGISKENQKIFTKIGVVGFLTLKHHALRKWGRDQNKSRRGCTRQIGSLGKATGQRD